MNIAAAAPSGATRDGQEVCVCVCVCVCMRVCVGRGGGGRAPPSAVGGEKS